MFTDIVGYTLLGQENESLALELLENHRQLLRPLFSKHAGHEVKAIGDAFLVEFASALEATLCAIDVQSTVHSRNLERGEKLQVRIGIHVGDVVHQGGDVLGDAVNIASRIEPLAGPGGICISEQVRDHVKNKISYPLIRLEPKELKNVRESVEVYKVALPWEGQADKTGAPPQLDTRRVAILPFANFSPDPDDGFFADGLTEEIISTVSSISGLSVISRTSVMGYKGTAKKVGEIGKELDVGSILEGSVRKAGNRVRIATQLIEVMNDRHVWAQSYDREMSDIFAVQSDIAKQVADSLSVRILAREAVRIEKKPTENTEAYMLYLKGRQYWNKRSEDAVHRAMEYFQLAVDGDPNFALALVGIADCWHVLGNFGDIPSAELAPKVKQAVLKALKLDNTLAEAHTSYAFELARFEWKWEEAELEFRRAIELNPNYATAHHWYAFSVLRFARRLDEELREAQKALELDPLAPVMSQNMGQTFYFREQFDQAIEYFEKALAIDPNFLFAYQGQIGCYLASSRFDKGVKLAETYVPKLFSSETRTKLELAEVYGIAGRLEEARRLLAEVEHTGDKEHIPPIEFARAYSGMGEADKMFEYLDRAVLQKDQWLPFVLVNPLNKRYRLDPRFLALKSKVGI